MSTLFQQRLSYDVLSTRLALCSEHFIRYNMFLSTCTYLVIISFVWRRAQKYSLDCWAYVTLTYAK
jgi:hypothetical protein